ncbi:MAG: disulfide bond formation protein B [Alphaproteobacteria bacterium]|nr:disulfide bond formation protein B [Alphaproteobacteria bacterium]
MFDTLRTKPHRLALMLAGLAALTLAGAFVFQFGFGIEPCALCYQQRYAYYAALPLALVLAGLAAREETPGLWLVILFALCALGFVANAALGVYHAGVEWHWWPGPVTCASGATGLDGEQGSLWDAIGAARVVRCDEAAWRFLGLSLAGYNVLISLGLATIAAWGAALCWRK